MSDTSRRYRAIKQARMPLYRPRPTGHRDQHLTTLVALIRGLVGGRHAHRPTIADRAPSRGATQASLIERLRRFLRHGAQTGDAWCLPVAQALLQALAHQPLQVVMDGGTVGRGCSALLVSVADHGRALPLGWVVVAAPTGHCPEAAHRTLRAHVHALIPPDATVISLGDGEFDGVELQAALRRDGWRYACRTAATIPITAGGVQSPVGAVTPALGEALAVTPARMTAARDGPISRLAVWEPPSDYPPYLATNLRDLAAAVAHDRQRAHSEPFCSDQQSRGSHLHQSHPRAPARLSRLLIAACLAYPWLVYLGGCARRDDRLAQIHRRDRGDLGLFRLGPRLLARCLKDDLPIPAGFLVPPVAPPILLRPPSAQAQAA